MKGFYLPFWTWLSIYRDKKYWILGSNFSLHKTDFIAINGYDEEISGYGLEDTNLELRLIMYGCQIKSLTHEALQYHLYHPYSLVNRSQEEISKIISPQKYYVEKGLNS